MDPLSQKLRYGHVTLSEIASAGPKKRLLFYSGHTGVVDLRNGALSAVSNPLSFSSCRFIRANSYEQRGKLRGSHAGLCPQFIDWAPKIQSALPCFDLEKVRVWEGRDKPELERTVLSVILHGCFVW